MPYILLVEDNPSLIEVMREILETENYRVNAVHNGQEALATFQHETPDLILSDVMMPLMDGFALLEAVRAHPNGAAVPFLFVSARTESNATSQARKMGADDYLFKPFTADELCLAVRAKLERRSAVQRFDTYTAHLQTVTMLANVIEARDKYTRGHVERVKNYALILARRLNWSQALMQNLEFGALLHDIGKILVPRHVLNKASTLTAEEWAILREHPRTGANMLTGLDHLQGALPYVLYHHERWDGTGYPTGLAGMAVPLEGRLLAIADTYDAMTSDRAYRGALSKDEALDEIGRRAGTQFDPELVPVFLTLFTEK